jgi:hypothetical protein
MRIETFPAVSRETLASCRWCRRSALRFKSAFVVGGSTLEIELCDYFADAKLSHYLFLFCSGPAGAVYRCFSRKRWHADYHLRTVTQERNYSKEMQCRYDKSLH